jgi:hypothetical protein
MMPPLKPTRHQVPESMSREDAPLVAYVISAASVLPGSGTRSVQGELGQHRRRVLDIQPNRGPVRLVDWVAVADTQQRHRPPGAGHSQLQQGQVLSAQAAGAVAQGSWWRGASSSRSSCGHDLVSLQQGWLHGERPHRDGVVGQELFDDLGEGHFGGVVRRATVSQGIHHRAL